MLLATALLSGESLADDVTWSAHTITTEADGAQSVPAFIAVGWLAVSQRIGRHPTIDYANCVLYNWERVENHAPLTPESFDP